MFPDFPLSHYSNLNYFKKIIKTTLIVNSRDHQHPGLQPSLLLYKSVYLEAYLLYPTPFPITHTTQATLNINK